MIRALFARIAGKQPPPCNRQPGRTPHVPGSRHVDRQAGVTAEQPIRQGSRQIRAGAYHTVSGASVMTGYIYSGQMELFGQRKAVGFGDDDFAVKEIDRGLANAIIQRNHYSRKFYSASYIHLGVFIGGELVGVLQFGYAMNPASQASVVAGTAIDEYLELNRMWLDDCAPRNSESRALSYALKIIRSAYPKVKWVQSFADERCGLGGIVYQACNFRYYGEHRATFWEFDGEMFHNSIMTDSRKADTPKGRKLQANKDSAIAHDLRQFRYLYFMKPRFSKHCLHAEKPYPKIAARPADELATSQREEGATPSGRSNNTAAA